MNRETMEASAQRPPLRTVAWASLVAVLIAPIYSILGLFGLAAGAVFGLFSTGLAGFVAGLYTAISIALLSSLAPAMLCLVVALVLYFRGLSLVLPGPWIVIGAVTGSLLTAAAYGGGAVARGDVGPVVFLLASSAFGGGLAGGAFWSILRGRLVWFARIHVLVLLPIALTVGWSQASRQLHRLDEIRCANQGFWSSTYNVVADGISLSFDAPICAHDGSDYLTVYFPEETLVSTPGLAGGNEANKSVKGARADFTGRRVFELAQSEYSEQSDHFGVPILISPGVTLYPPAETNFLRDPRPFRRSKAKYHLADVVIITRIERFKTINGVVSHRARVNVALNDELFFSFSQVVRDADLERSVAKFVNDALAVIGLVREARHRASSASS